MPASFAESASRSISATSLSLARALRVASASRPISAAACASTVWLVRVGALGEIKIHQPLFHLGRFADFIGPSDQAVRVERVGLATDLVHRMVRPSAAAAADTRCAMPL